LGANPIKNGGDLVVFAQDGSVVSVVTGKDELVGAFGAQTLGPSPGGPNTPEPTTWVIWAGMAGGMAWHIRRSRRSRS
jgi:hypothetical protein